ncbi:MAG: DUF996 domain-containing protein [Brevinematales bacterium]|nr:DUF996 domain-containing protein [Brevinematales bacterium]
MKKRVSIVAGIAGLLFVLQRVGVDIFTVVMGFIFGRFVSETINVFSSDIDMWLNQVALWWEKIKVPFLSVNVFLWVLLFVAFILFLIGIALLAKRYKDEFIFERAWMLFLVPLIGWGIFGGWFVVLFVLFSLFLGLGISMESDMQMFFVSLAYPFSAFGMIIALLVVVAIAVIPMWQMRKISESLSSHTGVSLFKVAGKWFFWGGWLSLLPFVGEIVMMVGWILFSLGSFQKITSEGEGK